MRGLPVGIPTSDDIMACAVNDVLSKNEREGKKQLRAIRLNVANRQNIATDTGHNKRCLK